MSLWTFEDWMETTGELQRNSFGVDPSSLDGEERAEFIRWNVLAAIDELMEMLHETKWKPWAKDQGHISNREAVVSELVDVLHFVGNLFVTVDASGEEISNEYERKQAVNAQRQRVGYDTDRKCRICGEAFDSRFRGDTCTRCMMKLGG